MTKLPEIVSTVRRRRAWSVEEKIEILDAAFCAGGSVAAACDRFDVSRALVYIWRKQVQNGLMPGVAMTEAGVSAFAPVAVVPEVPPLAPPPVRVPHARRLIEVRLVNGRAIKADEGIAPDVLARLVAALDGERT